MRILFILSGNKKEGISPITKAQGESLREHSVEVEYYSIKGKGLIRYIQNIFTLRRFMKGKSFDVFHAHYSFSGFVAGLAGTKPLIVSLMGSDVKARSSSKWFILFFYRFFWSRTIVKSNDLKVSLGLKDILVIPNGVNLNKFIPMNKNDCQAKLKWDTKKTHVLFPSHPNRPEKNYKLFKDSLDLLKEFNFQKHSLVDVKHEDVPLYMNASHIVVLTSIWEGSPNVIKEVLACNRPIVSTDVGDVSDNFNGIEGCLICSNDPMDVAKKIKEGLKFDKTNAREKITHLSSDNIARQLIRVYQSVTES